LQHQTKVCQALQIKGGQVQSSCPCLSLTAHGSRPSAHDRLCGDHFVRKKPSDNPDDIDYVPTVFNDHKGERAATRKRRGERSERLERHKRLKEEAIEAQRSQEAAATLLDLSRAYHVQDQPTSLVDIGKPIVRYNCIQN